MQFEIGTFVIAPRPRFSIDNLKITPNLSDAATSSCNVGCDGPIKNWDIVFDMFFIGHGDSVAPKRNFKAFQAYLNGLCASNTQKLSLSLCGEPPEEYYVSTGYIQPTNLERRYDNDCCDVLTGEVHIRTVDLVAGPEILIYDYNILKPVDQQIVPIVPLPDVTYIVTNTSTDREYDGDTVTLDELSDVVGTLINDLGLS